jgi:hypothetical protein
MPSASPYYPDHSNAPSRPPLHRNRPFWTLLELPHLSCECALRNPCHAESLVFLHISSKTQVEPVEKRDSVAL